MLSSDWLIISRGSLVPSCMLTLPAVLLILTSYWTQRHKQWFSWNGAVKAFFIRPALQSKNAPCQSLEMRNEMYNEKLFVFWSLQVNLGYFISQVFISVLGNHYMFSIWKNVHFCFPWHLCYIQTTLQFHADKDFPSHMVYWSNRSPLRMNRDNLYYSDVSLCGFCNFPTKLWCLKMTFWKLDLTTWKLAGNQLVVWKDLTDSWLCVYHFFLGEG